MKFEEIWAKTGYQYGPEALSNVRTGWNLAVNNVELAFAELVTACKDRDALGMRPSDMDACVDCSGHSSREIAHYDGVQKRYRDALEACWKILRRG